jgi:hypothetical protein
MTRDVVTNLPSHPQKADYEDAIAKLSDIHGSVNYPAALADLAELMINGQDAILPIACKPPE